MQLCIFEDSDCLNFEPITYSRPVFDLVCGINTLKGKILRVYNPKKYSLLCRSYIAPVLSKQNPGIKVNMIEEDSYLFINGSIIASEKTKKIIPFKHKTDVVYKYGNKIIAAFISSNSIHKIKSKLSGEVNNSVFNNLPVKKVEVKFASYIWDLINLNGEEIKNDLKYLSSQLNGKKKINSKTGDGVYLVNKKNIIIEKDCKIKPGAVIDASEGPVFIGKNTIVHSNAVIEGPAFIGNNSQINSGAYIHDNVSICEWCKIGGEVEDSVFMPYSNKQHAGFIGHAYIGSWVNLGADTNCSDLKNNYGTVKAYVNGKQIDSGSQFLGLMMGDHSKSAINTMFNTGTNAGFSSNIFGADFPDKFIPSFSWGGSSKMTTYNINKALETAAKVMARRNKKIQSEDEELFKTLFEMTKDERRKRGYPV